MLTGTGIQAEVGARDLDSGLIVVDDPVLSGSAVAVVAECKCEFLSGGVLSELTPGLGCHWP